MRIDMAKVVTEKPRRGHGSPSKKWGRRLGKNEHDAEDHGPTRAPIARRHQYGWNAKEFSDLLGPLRRYLRKQVGRPWNNVWSEIVRSLDSRSLSGQHIFDHIRWEVEQQVWLSPDGSLYRNRWSGLVPVGAYMVIHLLTNSTVLNGTRSFQRAVDSILLQTGQIERLEQDHSAAPLRCPARVATPRVSRVSAPETCQEFTPITRPHSSKSGPPDDPDEITAW